MGPLPVSPPPHIVAFVDQVDADKRAGRLANDVPIHIDAYPHPGGLVLRPRICTGTSRRARRSCEGACS